MDVSEAPRGRELWLIAGQELLRRGGAPAVKLPALTRALGLTTGSFYHHFAGMPDYLAQLARHYGTEQPRAGLAQVEDPDPRVRLRRLYALALDDEMRPLDAAMRDWAGSDPEAAAAVRAADAILLEFLATAFADLGHAPAAARARAQLMFAAGVAHYTPPWPVDTGILDEVLDILAPDDAAAAPARSTDQTRSVGRSSKPSANRPASSAVRSQSKMT